MKRLMVFVALFMFVAPFAMAKGNSVIVSGDLVKDGRLLIAIDWTVDSANYPGLNREQIMEKVQDEMWGQMLPKIVKATKDAGASMESSNLILISENSNLIEKRPNGTRLYAVKMQVEYTPSATPAAAPAAPAAAPQKKTPKYEDALNQRWDNEF